MTTTCQDIVARARGFSILNPVLLSDTAEVLARIRGDQRELLAMIAASTRDFFQNYQAIASTPGVQRRVVDLTVLDPPLERILKVELGNGTEVSQVDILDPEAELAPRYTVRGQTLIEYRNEWNTGGSAAVTLFLTYVYGPEDIAPTGALTQLVSVPDEWADLLVLPLAAYCVHKDVGRESEEYARLTAMLTARRAAFLEYLSHYGGLESRRFDLPAPMGTKK